MASKGLTPLQQLAQLVVTHGRPYNGEAADMWVCFEADAGDGMYEWEIEVHMNDAKLNISARSPLLGDAVQRCIDHIEKAVV